MCDEGRYGFHHVHSDRRLTNVERRDGSETVLLEWSQVVPEIRRAVCPGRAVGGGAVAAFDRRRSLAVGEVRALRSMPTRWSPWDQCRSRAPTRRSRTALRSGPRSARTGAASKRSCGTSWGSVPVLGRRGGRSRSRRSAGRVGQRRLQDAIGSTSRWPSGWRVAAAWSCRTCSARRCWIGPRTGCPAATFAERDGSYVNHADRLQSVRLGHPAAGGRARRGGHLLAVAGRRRAGTSARRVLDEIAQRDSVLRSRGRGRSARWESI